MGNWNELSWPKPWYQQAYEFLTSTYVLPFTLTLTIMLICLLFILVTGRKAA